MGPAVSWCARPPAGGATDGGWATDKTGTGHGNMDVVIVKRAHEVPGRRKWPMSHLALARIAQRVTSPIVGISSVERLGEVMGLRGERLSPEEIYHEEPYRPRKIKGQLIMSNPFGVGREFSNSNIASSRFSDLTAWRGHGCRVVLRRYIEICWRYAGEG